MGITLHSREVDKAIDPSMTDSQLKMQKRGLKELEGPRSSLIWHVCLLFDQYYSIFYFIFMISIHVYKYYVLLYPPSVWTMELMGLVILGITQAVRIYIGIQANRTEGAIDSLLFFILTVPVAYTLVHYTTLVTYVLTIEILISVVPLVLFTPIELVFSLVAWRRFRKIIGMY